MYWHPIQWLLKYIPRHTAWQDSYLGNTGIWVHIPAPGVLLFKQSKVVVTASIHYITSELFRVAQVQNC